MCIEIYKGEKNKGLEIGFKQRKKIKRCFYAFYNQTVYKNIQKAIKSFRIFYFFVKKRDILLFYVFVVDFALFEQE